MNPFKIRSIDLPSGRSSPPAEVARFFGPSFSSRSELRLDSGVPLA